MATDIRPRILVVDDEEKVCGLLRELLSRQNYDVDTCLDGRQAEALIAKADYQVVISDLKMPGMSGFELIERIKKNHPQIATIIFTTGIAGMGS